MAKKASKAGAASKARSATGSSSGKSSARKVASKTSKKRTTRKSTPKSSPTKKTTAKKSTTKKTATKKTATKKTAAKKTTSKKSTTGKSSASKKPAAKKSTKKTTATKSTSKPSASNKSAGKKPAKNAAKSASKASNAKPASKKPAADKPTKPAESKTSKKSADKAAADSKTNRKGITIVSKKRPRSERPKPSTAMMSSAGSSSLSSLSRRKPLIPSGPKAAGPVAPAEAAADAGTRKSPFNARQLDKYRRILLEKKRELIGGVSGLESEALRGNSGSLSHVSQHMADQGSDAADQSLSLDLAAAERKLIREIDDALDRIENKTYGLCLLTAEPISPERLEELPWARYSIAAARQLERHAPRE